MAETDTLTIRLPAETKEQLGKLAAHTNRTKSYLAGEAIQDYVTRELEIIAGIEQGVEDMKHGRGVPHTQAVARLRVAAASPAKR